MPPYWFSNEHDKICKKNCCARYILSNHIIASSFEFGSWSGNIDFTSSVNPETTFKASRYGNVTANFVVPPTITLPEGYWTQLIGILLTVMVPAIIGWFVPSIAGWINGWR